MGPDSRLFMSSLRALFLLGLFSLSYGNPIQGIRRILEGSLYGSLRFLSELSLRLHVYREAQILQLVSKSTHSTLVR